MNENTLVGSFASNLTQLLRSSLPLGGRIPYVRQLLESPFGKMVVLNCFGEVLEFITRNLDASDAPVVSTVDAQGIQLLLKTVITIAGVFVNHIRSSWAELGIAAIMPCLLAMVRSDVLPRELNFLAGVAFAAFLDLSGSCEISASRFLFLLTESSFKTPEPFTQHVAFLLELSHVPDVQPSSLPDSRSNMTLLRGMLSVARAETLLVPISYRPMLTEILFPLILRFCERQSSSPDDVYAALQCLGLWFSTSLKILASFCDSTINEAFQALFDEPSTYDRVLKLVWTYWDNPIEGLAAQVQSVFGGLLALLEMYGKTDKLLALVVHVLSIDCLRKVCLLHLPVAVLI